MPTFSQDILFLYILIAAKVNAPGIYFDVCILNLKLYFIHIILYEVMKETYLIAPNLGKLLVLG